MVYLVDYRLESKGRVLFVKQLWWMEIKLKEIYVGDRDGRERVAFQATLFIDGYKVGVVSNEGRGGAIQYHPLEDKGCFLIRKAESWCRKLPPAVYADTTVNGKPATAPMELEIYLDNIITAWLEPKDLKKFRLKMEKDMQWAILYGIPGKLYRVFKCTSSIYAIANAGNGVCSLRWDLHRYVLPFLGEKGKILNTNIPERIRKELRIADEKWDLKK